MMLRSFLPVGQGAFYCEQFKKLPHNINVVYDCGSITPGVDIEKEIKANFNKNEEILILFISHFHEDHINGIDYLIKYCNVKNIVFPLVYREDRILLSIDYICNSKKHESEDPVYRLINNPIDYIKETSSKTIIYPVIPINKEENIKEELIQLEENDRVRFIYSGENVIRKIFTNKSDSSEDLMFWEYIPYNFKKDNRKDIFYKALSAELTVEIDYSNIEYYVNRCEECEIRNSFKNAYQAVNKDFNANSMTLFSGTRNHSIVQRVNVPYYNNNCCIRSRFHHKSNGCLYFGDYSINGRFRWKELQDKYKEYWEYIGCIQIPHHGSKDSYNRELSLMNAFYIVSAGKSNGFSHPHLLVIKDLLFEHKSVYIVTEDRDSLLISLIDSTFPQ